MGEQNGRRMHEAPQSGDELRVGVMASIHLT